MKHKVLQVRNYNFTDKDQLFLNANIWLYLRFSQKPFNYWEKTYSNVFKRILNGKSQIYIDVLVVTEFINTYARRKWKLITPRFKSFKTFRNSSLFNPIAKDIAADAKRVVGHCQLIESGFVGLRINDLLDDYANGDSDFNDQIIAEICKSNGLTLVTHDGDFRTHEIPILTANTYLLRNS